MSNKPHLWLRAECRPTERRTPLMPDGVRHLMEQGFAVTVERSANRIIQDADYARTGCGMAETGSWVEAGDAVIVLGIKELPDTIETLRHRHIFFGHAYKDQSGWQEFLQRFQRGGGTLLDIEYMVDEAGRRVTAFGYWAGYMGAALALEHWWSRNGAGPVLENGVHPYEDAAALDNHIKSLVQQGCEAPRVLVIGALGRSGRGAIDLISRHHAKATSWDIEETRVLDRDALLDHDIFINCALIQEKIPAFLTRDDLAGPGNLTVISDVSCDPTSDINPLPFYSAPTDWEQPFIRVADGPPRTIDLIAIDNLPSLLPRESSQDFADTMLPHLSALDVDNQTGVWARSLDRFQEAVSRMGP